MVSFLAVVAVIGAIAAAVIFLLSNSRRKSGLLLANERPIEHELRQQLALRETELTQVRSDLNKVSQQNGELAAQAKFFNEALLTERKQIETIEQRFQKEFEAVSNKLLLASSDQFSKQSSKGLEAVLQPIKDE